MKYTIQHRRGSTSQWNTANSVLAFGEVGVENTGAGLRSKIGDGTTAWTNLPYVDDVALTAAIDAADNAAEGDVATLASAKSHADSGDSSTLTAAKAYSDLITAGLAGLLVDTGWRNITALFQEPASSGAMYLRREGKRIHVHVSALTYTSNKSFARLGTILPAGFRPSRTTDFAAARRISADLGGSIRFDSAGDGYIYQIPADTAIYGSGSFLTDNPVPTSLPGTPA